MSALKKTKVDLLDSLKSFSERTIKDMIFPVKPQKGDAEQIYRCPAVYEMRLPDSTSAMRKAPYILHQVLTGSDVQSPGKSTESDTVIRSIFCVYSDDEQEGALMLLNLMERILIQLLRERVLDNQFELDLDQKLESLIYPDNTAPFFAGEMVSVWKLPAVEREIQYE